MLYNFGDIHSSTMANNDSVTLRFRYNDFQNTMVTFQIDASDITYVYSMWVASACSFCSYTCQALCVVKSACVRSFNSCSASGRIVNAYANNFDALKDNGFIYVEIENTGEVTSEFSVSC